MRNRDSRLGIRDSGLGLTLLLTFASLCHARAQSIAPADGTLRIVVRVYTYADISTRTLLQAEAVATRIFREAGVKLEWLDCPTSHAEEEKYPACEPPLGAMAVDLRIVPPSMAARLRSSREEAGLALPSAQAGGASAA